MGKFYRISHVVKLLVVIIIGMTPLAFLRNFLYRRILGYNIARTASIGFLTFLDAEKVTMEERSYLKGIFNIILDVGELEMASCSKMGSPRIGFNFVSGNGVSKLHLKRGARVTWGHFFDVSDNITIGSMTIIGGKSCEFFTHDMYNGKRFGPIEIGDGCYIGSSSKFCLGAKIPNRCVVTMGTVISKKFEKDDVLIGGVPAEVIREEYGYNAKITYDELELPY